MSCPPIDLSIVNYLIMNVNVANSSLQRPIRNHVIWLLYVAILTAVTAALFPPGGLLVPAVLLLPYGMLGVRERLILSVILVGVAALEPGVALFSAASDAVTATARDLALLVAAVIVVMSAETPRLVIAAWAGWVTIVMLSLAVSGGDLASLAAASQYVVWPSTFILGYALARDKGVRRLAYSLLLVILLANALSGIWQYFTQFGGVVDQGSALDLVSGRFGVAGAIGLTPGRPALGLFLSMGICLAIWRLIQVSEFRARIWWAALLPISLTASIVTFSRTSWFAGLIGVLVVLALSRQISKRGILVLALLLLASTSFGTLLVAGNDRDGGGALEQAVHQLSLRARLDQWSGIDSVSGSGVSSLLIGEGPGSVGYGVQVDGRNYSSSLLTDTDNTYLRVLVDLGLVGLSALMVVLFLIGRQVWRTPRRPLGLSILAILLVSWLTVDGWYFPLIPISFLVLGLSSGSNVSEQ